MDILIFIISLVASFIFSLGGIGAAIILIPILVSFGIPISVAKPVGLFFNAVSMTGASINNIKNKRLDFGTGTPIIIASFIFAATGAYLSEFISARIILMLFIIFLLFSGMMLLLHKKRANQQYRKDRPFIKLTLIGVVAGLLSGILGIGGGSVISPLMLMTGFNPKKITAITAFAIPFSSFSGFLTYWAIGNVNWQLLITVSVAGIIGATLGTMFMQKKLNPVFVKKILAAILIIMAIKLIFKIL